eukprot:scaffold8681_cov96-Skeletonema_dohrnii-CCMP3373.AAC.4
MAATTSGSIDIYGSQAACDQERVSRTMPANLSGRITSGDWTILCDDLDKALKPSSGIEKLTYAWHVVIPLAFVIFLMFGFLRLFASDENDFRWSSIMVVVLIVIVGNVCVLVIKSVQRNKIQKELIEICDQTSASHPGISFHVRYEMRMGKQNSCESSEGNDDCDDCNNERRRDYIEVCVAPVAASSVLYSSSLPPVAVAEAYVVPSTSFVPSADPVMPSAPPKSAAIYPYDDPEMPIVKEKKTAQERMKDLDRMKDIITEEEYYRKRAEILSDI